MFRYKVALLFCVLIITTLVVRLFILDHWTKVLTRSLRLNMMQNASQTTQTQTHRQREKLDEVVTQE
jgi:hypothetical protein